jgi:hypothetical protein
MSGGDVLIILILLAVLMLLLMSWCACFWTCRMGCLRSNGLHVHVEDAQQTRTAVVDDATDTVSTVSVNDVPLDSSFTV